MPKFKFSKLVRDKIVDHQIASGAKPSFRKLSTKEHKRELVNKIIEEAQEIITAIDEDVIAEIADVQQAVDTLKELYGISDETLLHVQKQKNDKNGMFSQGLYIDYVEVLDDDKWVEYYRKNADRYPEIK